MVNSGYSHHIYSIFPRSSFSPLHFSCSFYIKRSLNVLLVGLANEPDTGLGVVGSISLHNLAKLESTTLNLSTSNRSLQLVCARLDSKVGERDLVRISVDNCGQTKVVGLDLVIRNVQLKVAAIINVVPLQLRIGTDKPSAGIISGGQSDILSVRARRRDGRTGELNTNTVVAEAAVVVDVVKPDKIADPRSVAVTRHDNVVADIVLVEMVQGTVAVCLVAIPGVVIEGVDVAISGGLVDAGENCGRSC